MPIKLQHETRHPRAVRPRTLSIPYGGSPRTRIHAHEQEHKYTYICLQHLDANHFTSNLLEPSPFTHTPRLFLFFLSRYIHINTYPSQLQPQPQKAKTNKTRYLPPPFPSLFTAKQHFPPTFLREKKPSACSYHHLFKAHIHLFNPHNTSLPFPTPALFSFKRTTPHPRVTNKLYLPSFSLHSDCNRRPARLHTYTHIRGYLGMYVEKRGPVLVPRRRGRSAASGRGDGRM